LRVLLPNDPQNYYQQRDILPAEWMTELAKAKIIITNFHAFKQRELVDAGKLTKNILAQGTANSLNETPSQMVRRVCRELGNKRNSYGLVVAEGLSKRRFGCDIILQSVL